MTAIAKASTFIPSLITTLPGHEHMVGPDLTAGEDIGPVDACYIDANGLVLRSLESQVNAASAINDVQTLTIPANAVDGEFQLVYPIGTTNVTPQLSWNQAGTPVTASGIQTALQALASVGASNMTVTSAVTSAGTVFTITGAGSFAGTRLESIGVDSSLIQAGGVQPDPVATIVHTTVGEAAGTTAEQFPTSKVRGYSPIKVRKGNPITLYHGVAFAYSDQLLTPGQDLYLSSTVPGGLDTAATLTGQPAVGYAVDNTRVVLNARN